ncbi:serine/threonine-protein kinase [Streptomyces sp. NPDC048629]|uniref:serine/threonine-protein kinase n=1 Tax=Streptomyces sp. NPDC048629 TaxID=3154824 RepID=UPI00343E0C8C
MSAGTTGSGSFAITVPEGYRVGPWTVERPLGAGAFGSVYAAVRRAGPGGTPDRAALKFLPTGTCGPRQLRHLRDLAAREVELLGRLRAPRLIRMYETLTVDDPERPELDGATVLVLEEAADSLHTALPRLAPRERAEVLVQVCEGLAQLHGAGWVHGDIKPGNVLLMADGSARLGDFSTASELDGTHAYSPAFATADYTPPELLWSEFGERGTRTRPTADLWAFGVLAHVVLTDTFPLPGGTPSARRDAAVRYARGDEELRLSPELPDAWREIVTACLSRNHEDRALRAGRDAAALLERVRAAAQGRVPRRRRRRRPGLVVTGLAATAMGIALTAGMLLPDDPPGWERCAAGSICFFAERDGRGEMCTWVGGSKDWLKGGAACPWASERGAKSAYNNGYGPDMGTLLVDVALFTKPQYVDRMDCLTRGSRTNFSDPPKPRSHEWVPNCAASPS